MTDHTNARELFQAAYENRYTWDSNFPGYLAEIEVKQGKEIHTGKICIHPDLKIEVTEVANPKVQESIYNQLRDLVTHRKRSTFEQSHGKNNFSIGKTEETGAIEILVTGEAMGSNYQIKDQEICHVRRVMGKMVFVIDTYQSFNTGSGYVATRYDAIFRNVETDEVIKVLKFEDSYEKIGDYYVMTQQVIHADEPEQQITTEFKLTNVKLLEPAVV